MAMLMGTAARGASLLLLAVLGCLYLITIGLASWAINRVLNYGQVTYIGSATSVASVVPVYGNVATPFFALVTLISGMVGLAAVFLGLQHITSWKTKTLAAANSAATIAWLLSLLALGFAFKEIRMEGRREHRLRTLEAFTIILPWVLLLQLAMWHAAMLLRSSEPYEYGPHAPVHGGHAPAYGGHATTPRQTV